MSQDAKKDVSVENKSKDATLVASESGSTEVKKKCLFSPFIKGGISVVIVMLVVLISTAWWWQTNEENKERGRKDMVKDRVEQFIKKSGAPESYTVKDVQGENGMYKVSVATGGPQDAELFLTQDGKKMFFQGMDMDELLAEPSEEQQGEAPAPEKTEASVKNAKPAVDLFVMSYCPYGLQMERGLIPAIQKLNGKIDFNLRFVEFSLHGSKEVDENVRQFCIQKDYRSKLNAYLACFWEKNSGESLACMKRVGINAAKVETCANAFKKQYSPTEQSMGVDKELNTKYGVKSSPTLVVNGEVLSSGRDSASVLKAICSGFEKAPKECEVSLDSKVPSYGFDNENTGTASDDASC